MKEFVRTVILLIALALLLGYIYTYQRQAARDLAPPVEPASGVAEPVNWPR